MAGVARQFIDGAAEPGPGGRSGGARRGPAEEEFVVPAQHRFMHPTELIAGIDPELVAQSLAHVLMDGQGLRLAFAAVQGAHAQRHERLVVRTGRRQGGETVQGIGEPTEQDQALEPFHPNPEEALQQSPSFHVGERSGQPGQRLAVEQGERGRQPVHRGGRIAGRLRAPSALDVLGQIRRIELDVVDDEAVPAPFPADHRIRRSGALRVEGLPQLVDVAGQYLAAGSRWLGPQTPSSNCS